MKGSRKLSKHLSEFEKLKHLVASLAEDEPVTESVEEMGRMIEELEHDAYFRFNDKFSLGLLKERYDEMRNYAREGKHSTISGTFEFWGKMVELEQKRSRLDEKRRGNK